MHAGVRRTGRWAGRVDLGGSDNGGGNRDSSRSRTSLALALGRADTATVGDELRNVWPKTVRGAVMCARGLLLKMRSDRIGIW